MVQAMVQEEEEESNTTEFVSLVDVLLVRMRVIGSKVVVIANESDPRLPNLTTQLSRALVTDPQLVDSYVIESSSPRHLDVVLREKQTNHTGPRSSTLRLISFDVNGVMSPDLLRGFSADSCVVLSQPSNLHSRAVTMLKQLMIVAGTDAVFCTE